MLDESPTSTNLGNDPGFIIKEYYLHWYEAFWKALRVYAQSGQCHTIVDIRDSYINPQILKVNQLKQNLLAI